MEDQYAPPKATSSGSSGSKGSKSKKSASSGTVQQSAAVVSQPAAETKAKAPTPKKAPAADEDDYGDDFEDYNDDFEDADEPVVVNQAKISAPARESKPVPAPAPAQVPAPAAPVAAAVKASSSSSTSQHKKSLSSSASMSSAASAGDAGGERKKAALQKLNFSLSLPKGSSAAARRLQRLAASNVLDLQLEKTVTVLSLPSSTGLDLYHRQLRAVPPTIRQVGCPSEEESREMEVQTDEIGLISQTMQFCYGGDDTDFYDALEAVRARRGGRAVLIERRAVATAAHAQISQFSVTGTRLSAFLHGAVPVVETLLREEEQRRRQAVGGSGSSSGSRHSAGRDEGTCASLFGPGSGSGVVGSGALVLGTDDAAGGNELLRTRKISSTTFSERSPHLLACVHPLPAVGSEAEAGDLRPGKGLVSLWDCYAPSSPQFLLQTPGDPTCVSFSASQGFLVLAGCVEGTLHLWDLREPSELHRDADSVDLKVTTGIRKPSFSTSTELVDGSNEFSTASNDSAVLSSMQHAAAITAIHPIPSAIGAAMTVSQWASLDALGTVTMWVTSAVNSYAVKPAAPGQAPWASVVLSPTKVLRVSVSQRPRQPLGPLGANSTNSTTKATTTPQELGAKAGNSYEPIIAPIPADPGAFLASTGKGRVKRVQRFEESSSTEGAGAGAGAGSGSGSSSSGQLFSRATEHVQMDQTSSGSGTTSYFSAVTCLAVGPRLQHPEAAVLMAIGDSTGTTPTSLGGGRPMMVDEDPLQLCAVGRADGTVDVYSLQHATPLRTFALHTLREAWERTRERERGGGSSRKGGPSGDTYSPSPVRFICWFPGRPSAFVAITKSGLAHVVDLLLGGLQSVDSLPAALGGQQTGTKVKRGGVALSMPVLPSAASAAAAGGRDLSQAVSHLAVVISGGSSALESECRTLVVPVWNGWNSCRKVAVSATGGAASEPSEAEFEAALRRALWGPADGGCGAASEMVVEGSHEGRK